MTTNEQPLEKKRRRWLMPVVVGVISFTVGALAGSAGSEVEPEVVERTIDPSDELLADLEAREAALDDRETELLTEIEDREAALHDALEAREAELDERASEIEQVEREIEEGRIPGPGIYLVGVDIEPGEYRTDGDDCYWARLSGTSGEIDDVIANGFADGPSVINISSSDYAFENKCAEWQKS